MVVAHIATDLYVSGFALSFVIHPGEVAAYHLAGSQSTAAPATEAAPAAVAGIVGIAENSHAPVLHETGEVQVSAVAALGAVASIDVQTPSLTHTFLNSKVKHSLLLAVIYSRDTGVVALAIVGPDLADHTSL